MKAIEFLLSGVFWGLPVGNEGKCVVRRSYEFLIPRAFCIRAN
jgi:hypothetical protein